MRVRIGAVFLLGILFASMLSAQEHFPARLLTVVNPNAPGGTSDIITRAMSESLQRLLKQPVVTVNRVGAGGAVGGAYVAKAPADGYTVLLNTVTHVLIPITEGMQGRSLPYSLSDYMLLARVTADPLLFVVHPSLPVASVKELVALAKRRPGEMTYSSPGLYSSGHISMAMLLRQAGINLLHTPFNGAGPAMIAVLGGHVFMMHAPAGVASPHVKSGRVRMIAQTGGARSPAFLEAPTLKETGYDAEFVLWAGYFAHANTPAVAVRAWQSALRESSADPKFRSAMDKLSVNVDYLDGPALKTWYDNELKRLDAAVRAIGKIEGRT